MLFIVLQCDEQGCHREAIPGGFRNKVACPSVVVYGMFTARGSAYQSVRLAEMLIGACRP